MNGGLYFPVPNQTSTSWSWGAPRYRDGRYHHAHQGADIFGGANSPIVSVKPGVVSSIGAGTHSGTYVYIDHGDGTTSRYMHLASVGNISQGQRVEGGQVIGLMGNTGATNTPVHLHFEYLINGKAVDPKGYLSGDNVYHSSGNYSDQAQYDYGSMVMGLITGALNTNTWYKAPTSWGDVESSWYGNKRVSAPITVPKDVVQEVTQALQQGQYPASLGGGQQAYTSGGDGWQNVTGTHYGTGDGLLGNPRADGVPLDAYTMGVAHPSLPLGTNVEVRVGNRTVMATVNDRGPADWTGAGIDLSPATARATGFFDIGKGPVSYRVVQ